MKVSSRVSRNLTTRLKKKGVEVGEKVAKEGAKFGQEYARKLYQDAEYDGTVENIKISVKKTDSGNYWITAEGPQVRAIEYGATGEEGTKVLHSHRTGDTFWFYKVEPGNRYRAGGRAKKEVKAVYRKDTMDPKAGFYMTRREAEKAWLKDWDQDKGLRSSYKDNVNQYLRETAEESVRYLASYENGKPHLTRDRSKIVTKDDKENGIKSGLVDSTRYGVTKGNKPQKVMEKTAKEISKEIGKKYGRH